MMWVRRAGVVLSVCVLGLSGCVSLAVRAERAATIMEIAGAGGNSPLIGQTVTTTGVVTASFQQKPTAATGFYIQDPQGDGDPATSDGLFVFEGKDHPIAVRPGDRVTVTGTVTDFHGMTELAVKSSASTLHVVGQMSDYGSVVALTPPANFADAQQYYHARVGMLVSVSGEVSVSGPTTRFNEFTVNLAGGAGRVFQSDEAQTAGGLLAVGDQGGITRDVKVDDHVRGLIGPLSYAFGMYRVDPVASYDVTSGPDSATAVGFVADNDEFTIGSFNVENFFDPTPGPGDDKDSTPTPDAYRTKLAKLSAAIANQLNAPTVLGVMEVENIGILNDLVAQPLLAPYGYQPILLPGLDPRGINVALLYRADRVTVTRPPETFNECVALNDNAYPPPGNPFGAQDYCAMPDGAMGNALFPRPPLVVRLDVRRADGADGVQSLTVVVNHFKAKSGDDPEKKNYTTRRTLEAHAEARYVDSLIRGGELNIAVLGDLNDFPNTPPLDALTHGGTPGSSLRDVVAEADQPYTYVFAGESEILDHILLAPGLAARFRGVEIAHIDADYPDRLADNTAIPNRISDHDPPVARFRGTYR